MKEDIKDFILSVGAHDSSAAVDTFNNIMTQKVSDAIQSRRQEVASSMFQNDGVEESVIVEDTKKMTMDEIQSLLNRGWTGIKSSQLKSGVTGTIKDPKGDPKLDVINFQVK